MPERNGHNLLWIDDDGPGRFLYEEYVLQGKGWRVVWATSVREALEILGKDGFDAILLDQMLPLNPGPLAPADVWGGCLLLYWLRGLLRPSAAPQVEEPDVFGYVSPLASNRATKVIIVSAFHDDEVEKAIRSAEVSMQIVKKPIDIDYLITTLALGDQRV